MFESFTKAQVLAALFNYSRPIGMGWMQHNPVIMDEKTAQELLRKQSYFDYVYGRPIKTSFDAFPDLSSSRYEHDNPLTFAQIEDHLKKGDPFPEPPKQKTNEEKSAIAKECRASLCVTSLPPPPTGGQTFASIMPPLTKFQRVWFTDDLVRELKAKGIPYTSDWFMVMDVDEAKGQVGFMGSMGGSFALSVNAPVIKRFCRQI